MCVISTAITVLLSSCPDIPARATQVKRSKEVDDMRPEATSAWNWVSQNWVPACTLSARYLNETHERKIKRGRKNASWFCTSDLTLQLCVGLWYD